MKPLALSCGIVVFALLFGPTHVFAAGEFKTEYTVKYAVSPIGTTTVTQDVSLVNQHPNLYPKEYEIIIDSVRIKNVVAHDSNGGITPRVTQKDGKTHIALSFNSEVVGFGSTLPFTLRYDSEDIAQRQGLIWEINIPGISDDPDLVSYRVTLDVPAEFGPNAYTSPLPSDGRTWTKEQLTAGGITAAYGTNQVFAIRLSYHLQNESSTQQIQEIAIPPDTAFQKVTMRSIDPLPTNVYRDPDGNWLARYAVPAGKAIDVVVSARVHVDVLPRNEFVEKTNDLTPFLLPTPHWQTEDPRIQFLANRYKTPKEIYDYVVKTLEYDYERVNASTTRKGAVQALLTPQGSICTDFTDLFIAIARAAGIPSRESVGYAYTTNMKLRPLSLGADILHAWPEYYDVQKNLWIPVDPTWGKTTGGINYFDKLDFNHIVLAIHGQSSEKPYPAGYYRRAGKKDRDVQVEFSNAPEEIPKGSIEAILDFPAFALSGFPLRGTLNIKNRTGVAVESVQIVIEASPYPFRLTKEHESIAPFSETILPLSLPISGIFSLKPAIITAHIGKEVHTVRVWIVPLPGAGVFFTLMIYALYVSIKKTVHLWTQSKKH
ncbi:MAG: transglutaminase family protein [bacterium]|nr:transglutaminase family protein [bacterium]